MRYFKHILALLFLLAAVSLSAQTAGQWWLGKPIYGIRFEGLNHVEEAELQTVVNPYLGKIYTNQLFSSLQNDLFKLQYFAYFSAQAEQGGESGEELIIIFQFVELPVIRSLDIAGNQAVRVSDIREVMTIDVGSFATGARIKETETAIRNLYISKGFTGVAVTSALQTDTQTNSIDLDLNISEGVQSKISAIRFEGNTRFSENTLKRIIVSRQQSLFNPGNYIETAILEDQNAIRKYYNERGFIDARVVNVITNEIDQQDTSKTMLELVFVIEEGSEWLFGGVSVNGNSKFSDEEIRQVITQPIGKPLNAVRFQENISNIARLYWNDGYVASKIDTTENRSPETRTISFNLSIVEGVQSVVEEVIITGQEKTKDFVLYRELDIQPGEIFSIDKLLQSMRNLYNTGVLEDVSYDILYGSNEDSVVIELSVIESNKVQLEFGATFGGTDEFPVSGFFSWTDKNFLGNGQDFSIALNISPTSQTLDFSFRESWIMNQRWSGGINLSAGHFVQSNILQDVSGVVFSDEDYENLLAAPDPYDSYAEYQAALAAGIAIPQSNLMSIEQYKFTLGLSSGYTFHTDAGRITVGGNTSVSLATVIYDDTLYRPYNPLTRNNLNNWQFTNKLGINFAWDGRDLIENTTTGFLLQQNLTYAGGILGGIANYIRTASSLSGYVTLFELPREEAQPFRGVLSAKTSVSVILPQYYSGISGWDWGIGATQTEKLYIDGMNIARGKTPPVYNLEFLWDSMLEFSVPIAERVLWGELYASATGYKDRLSQVPTMDISDYYFGLGAGIRLAIPGFPLGLYLTKNFYFDDTGDFHWEPGDILAGSDPESGLKLVLAITSTLF